MPRFLALVLASLLLCAGAPAEEPTLRVLTWSNYFPPSTLEEFQKETGARVELMTYESNEELQEKITTGLVGVDVVVPSDYMVRILRKQNQLLRLDPKKLPNLKNIDPRFLKLGFDPTGNHSVPYSWGTTGIGVNRSKVGGKIDTLSILFDPQYKGQIMMLDDPRACLGIALRLLGKSANTRVKADVAAAKAKLLEQKPLVVGYSGDKYADALVEGTIVLCLGYSGDVLRAKKRNGAIAYAVPSEGTILWIDNLCVMASTSQPDLAHAFLDFQMRPASAARLTNELFYATPNTAADALVRGELRGDRSLFPPKTLLDKCEFLEDLGGSEQMYLDAWKEIKGE